MDLNIKIRGKNKKKMLKISILVVCLNILITVIVAILVNAEFLKTIMLYLISIGYIVYVIYIWKTSKKINLIDKNKKFENKYDPILTRFLLKNEFELDKTLLNAEIYYLMKKGYIYIDKQKNTLNLKDRSQFKQMDALERIDSNKIKEYSTEEIPSYESMFVGKILFAFHNEIELKELRNKINQNYYYERGEMCKLTMEKMLLYECEKHDMLGNGSSISLISEVSILNIITSIMLFIVMGRFNIILLLSTILNIVLNIIIIKNENIFSYKYSDDIIKYVDDLLEYVDILKVEKGKHTKNNNKTDENIQDIVEQNNGKESDEELKILFGINDGSKILLD